MAAPDLSFDGGPVIVLARGAAVALLLLAFGTALFAAWVAPKALGRASVGVMSLAGDRLHRLLRLSLVAAAGTLLGWLAVQAADLAGTVRPDALWIVITQTQFGRVILAQVVVVVVALLALGRRAVLPGWRPVGLTGVALALQAGHSHTIAMDGLGASLLPGVLHLLAAGAWLGGLVPLLLLIVLAPPRIAAAAARRFTPLGKACVVAMLASAAFQVWTLVGGLPGLIGTAYGWTVGAKMLLLVVLLGFAIANRYRYAPALLARGAPAKRVLIRSIAVQTGVGVAAVMAAAMLSQLPPAIHEQPLWPFARRPSLVALTDPDLAWEIARALLSVAAAIALLLAGAAWRPVRWAAIGVAAVLAWTAAPHFDLLLVEAYPTSYYRSPTGFTAAALARGAALYPTTCATCHGADGRGDGQAAAGLAVPPADLTASHLWEHEDGEMFWWLSQGMRSPAGDKVMPGFADTLSAEDRWALIDYIRAQNAGIGLRDTGAWPRPVQAPTLNLACAGRTVQTSADLRGDMLHLVATDDATATIPPAQEFIEPGIRMVTVVLTSAGTPPPPGTCATQDPAAWAAMATLAGLAPDALSGAQFLVDADGWLRAMERPGERALRWADPLALLADARAICSNRIASASTGGHIHR